MAWQPGPRCERGPGHRTDRRGVPPEDGTPILAARWRSPRRCSRCGETDLGFLSLVRARTAVLLPAKVAVVAEDLVLLRKPLLDDGQVKHGPAAHLPSMSAATAVYVVHGQETAIGLSTASTASTVSGQHLVLEAIVVSPLLAANPVGVCCHLRGPTSGRLSTKLLFVQGIVVPLVLSTVHSTSVLESSLLSSQDAVDLRPVGSRRG